MSDPMTDNDKALAAAVDAFLDKNADTVEDGIIAAISAYQAALPKPQSGDLWAHETADSEALGEHYTQAVSLLTRRKVFAKSEVAKVIALHSQFVAAQALALAEARGKVARLRDVLNWTDEQCPGKCAGVCGAALMEPAPDIAGSPESDGPQVADEASSV